MINVVIVTHIMSPYQVELFNALTYHNAIIPYVIYVKKTSKHRQWEIPQIKHSFSILDDLNNADDDLEKLVSETDLVVFGYYRDPRVRKLIDCRDRANKPWCFWGERPGFNFSGLLGRLYRRWRLKNVASSNVPIWGIGKWAIDGYKNEFGQSRDYYNVPYFSNLDRFLHKKKPRNDADPIRFLFSGSLTKRKGIDLLADAFAQLADYNSNVRLHIMGSGPLKIYIQKKLHKYMNFVEFYGFKPWDKLHLIYQNSDILCVPSRYDGWGLVIPEGLASGMPVIATNQMGAAIDLIEEGQNGWIIPAGNRQALIDVMQKVIDISPKGLQEFSENARQSVAEHTLRDGVLLFEKAAFSTLQNWNK